MIDRGPSDQLDRLGLVGYVGIYLRWAWLFWGAIILFGRRVWTFPNVLLFYVGSLSPALGGLIMIRRSAGIADRRELLDRMSNLGCIEPRWYIVILGLYPALTIAASSNAFAT